MTTHEVTVHQANGVSVGFSQVDEFAADGHVETHIEYQWDADEWAENVGSTGRHHVQFVTPAMWREIVTGMAKAEQLAIYVAQHA